MALQNKFLENGSQVTTLKGEKPTGPLSPGPGVIPINNTFNNGTYQDYIVDVDPSRGSDTPPFSN